MLRSKIRFILPALAILSLGLITGCESTQQNKGRDAGAYNKGGHNIDKAKQRHNIIERFERFDKDGDGIVNISDVPQKARRMFKVIDTNNNGQLNEDEMERFEDGKVQRPHR